MALKNTRRAKTYTRKEVDKHCQGVLTAWTVAALQTLRQSFGFDQEQASQWLKETNATCLAGIEARIAQIEAED